MTILPLLCWLHGICTRAPLIPPPQPPGGGGSKITMSSSQCFAMQALCARPRGVNRRCHSCPGQSWAPGCLSGPCAPAFVPCLGPVEKRSPGPFSYPDRGLGNPTLAAAPLVHHHCPCRYSFLPPCASLPLGPGVLTISPMLTPVSLCCDWVCLLAAVLSMVVSEWAR